MKFVSIDYGLQSPHDDQRLDLAVASLGECIQPFVGRRLVKTGLTAQQVRDRLAVYVLPGKSLLVTDSKGQMAWCNMSAPFEKWFRSAEKPRERRVAHPRATGVE